MKTQPNPSDREVLAGLVERVTYQNYERVLCGSGSLRSIQTLLTVRGANVPASVCEEAD
jgi:hypothetical protein